jgi:hypothetical protein
MITLPPQEALALTPLARRVSPEAQPHMRRLLKGLDYHSASTRLGATLSEPLPAELLKLASGAGAG